MAMLAGASRRPVDDPENPIPLRQIGDIGGHETELDAQLEADRVSTPEQGRVPDRPGHVQLLQIRRRLLSLYNKSRGGGTTSAFWIKPLSWFKGNVRLDVGRKDADKCIFLCTKVEDDSGPDDIGIAIAVPFYRRPFQFGAPPPEPERSDSDEEVFRMLREVWYDWQGRWLRFVPFYEVNEVKEVRFEFIRRETDHFVVRLQSLHIDMIREDVEETIREHQEFLDQEFLEMHEQAGVDYHDTYEGHRAWHCGCATAPDYVCPLVMVENAKIRRSRLANLHYLKESWFDPRATSQRGVLKGMAQDTSILSRAEINFPIIDEQCFSEEVYRAIYVGMGLQVKIFRRRLPYMAAVVVGLVAIWKEVTGDWGVAFAFGSFIIALITLTLFGYKTKEKP